MILDEGKYGWVFNDTAELFKEVLDSRLIEMLSSSANQDGVYTVNSSILNSISKLKSCEEFKRRLNDVAQAILYETIFYCTVAVKNNFAPFQPAQVKNGGINSFRNVVIHSINNKTDYYLTYYKRKEKKKGKSYPVIACIRTFENTVTGHVKLDDICNLPKHKGETWGEVADKDAQYILWIYDTLEYIKFDWDVLREATETLLYTGKKYDDALRRIRGNLRAMEERYV